MSDRVHYLIRHPREKGSLIYPTELNGEMYVGFGSFYLLGLPGSRIDESYDLYAVLGEETIQTNLVRFGKSRNFFRAEVGGVGAFLFYAQRMAKQLSYVGSEIQVRGLIARWKLLSWKHDELDRACRKHDFYFIGYSPRLGD